MWLPSRLYIRYLLYLQWSSVNILQKLQEKLLCKDFSTEELEGRASSILKTSKKLVAENRSAEYIVEHLELTEMLYHFYMAPDSDMAGAFELLSDIPNRKLVEQGFLLGYSTAKIYEWFKGSRPWYSGSCPITERTLELYHKYFFNLDDATVQGVSHFLNTQDYLDHATWYNNTAAAKAVHATFNVKLEPEDRDKSNIEVIKERTFQLLQDKLLEGDPDPDICAKWFKLFSSSKELADSIVPTIEDPTERLLNVGFTDMPDIKLKTAAEFVTKATSKKPSHGPLDKENKSNKTKQPAQPTHPAQPSGTNKTSNQGCDIEDAILVFSSSGKPESTPQGEPSTKPNVAPTNSRKAARPPVMRRAK